MRALTRSRTRALFFGLSLLLVGFCFGPPAAEASVPARPSDVLEVGDAQEAVAVAVSDHQAEVRNADVPAAPASPAGAFLFAMFAAGAIGAVVSLRVKKFDTNGQERVETIEFDSEKGDFAEKLGLFGDAKAEEAAQPIRAQLAAVEKDGQAFRDLLIGEILRVEKLTAAKPDDYNVEQEKAFYETLTPEKLKLHFDKAVTKRVSLKAATTEGDPAPESEPAGDDAAFGQVRVL